MALPFLQVHPKQKSNFDTLPTEAIQLMSQAAYSVGHSMRYLGVEGVSHKQSLGFAKATKIADAVPNSEFGQLVHDGPVWDVVERIEYVGEEEVFDLSVPDVHNFVANDLFVHKDPLAKALESEPLENQLYPSPPAQHFQSFDMCDNQEVTMSRYQLLLV